MKTECRCTSAAESLGAARIDHKHQSKYDFVSASAAILCIITMLRVDWDQEALKAKERLQVKS